MARPTCIVKNARVLRNQSTFKLEHYRALTYDHPTPYHDGRSSCVLYHHHTEMLRHDLEWFENRDTYQTIEKQRWDSSDDTND